MIVVQLCPTLCDPMDYSPPGSSGPGILQVRIREWVAISFSRGNGKQKQEDKPFSLSHCDKDSHTLIPGTFAGALQMSLRLWTLRRGDYPGLSR